MVSDDPELDNHVGLEAQSTPRSTAIECRGEASRRITLPTD